MDLARFERRLRRSLESLLAVDNARLYRGKEVVYVPLRAPSPQPTRSSLSRSVQPDTALVEGTTRIADTIRASLDTIRTVTDTALIASDPAAGRNAIGERRIQMVETRLLDEGVFRAFEVNFAFGMATLKPRATRTLDAVGAVLERYPELRIEIGGHTDAVGTGAFNQRLSEARAKAVRTYLLEGFEIAPGRLSVRGYGEGQPVAPNDSPAGRALNRRVAFLVLNRGAVAFPNR